MPIPKSIILASHNRSKIKELQDILGSRCQVHDLQDYNAQWEEIGTTFSENALIKAQAIAQLTDLPILADDSGIEVLALQGRPGVFSSRYAGDPGNDAANNQKLLKELEGQDQREARFVCCLCYLDEERQAHFFEGTCSGHIGYELKGDQGFGYDPLFYPQGSTRSLGEFDAQEKNQISHRYQAMKKWMASLSY